MFSGLYYVSYLNTCNARWLKSSDSYGEIFIRRVSPNELTTLSYSSMVTFLPSGRRRMISNTVEYKFSSSRDSSSKCRIDGEKTGFDELRDPSDIISSIGGGLLVFESRTVLLNEIFVSPRTESGRLPTAGGNG